MGMNRDGLLRGDQNHGGMDGPDIHRLEIWTPDFSIITFSTKTFM